MENTVTLSLKRFKELETKERLLACSKRFSFTYYFGDNYGYFVNDVIIYSNSKALELAEEKNRSLVERINELEKEVETLKANKKNSWFGS